MNTEAELRLEIAQLRARYKALLDRCERVQDERNEARHVMSSTLSHLYYLLQDVMDDTAGPINVALAHALEHGIGGAYEWLEPSQVRRTLSLADNVWSSLGVNNWHDYLDRAANGIPTDTGVIL